MARSGANCLRVTFLRTAGERDRIYVRRSDGTEVSWVFPTYGDGLPHDLVHLVVETVFGLTGGFWGLVDAGADPGRISDEANRKGGKEKYAAFRSDRSDLQRAEALAAATWSSPDCVSDLRAAFPSYGVEAPEDLSEERAHETRQALGRLSEHWRRLLPKGALELGFHASSPRDGLPDLLRDKSIDRPFS